MSDAITELAGRLVATPRRIDAAAEAMWRAVGESSEGSWSGAHPEARAFWQRVARIALLGAGMTEPTN